VGRFADFKAKRAMTDDEPKTPFSPPGTLSKD
jgi:hypothetical protein